MAHPGPNHRLISTAAGSGAAVRDASYIAIPLMVYSGSKLFLGTSGVAASYTAKIAFPAGMKVTLLGFDARAGAITDNGVFPKLEIGNSTDADGYKIAVNLATGTGALLLDGALAINVTNTSVGGRAEINSGSNLVVKITNNTTSTATAVRVMAYGYVSAHPTVVVGYGTPPVIKRSSS